MPFLKASNHKKHISPFHTGIYVFNLLFSSPTKNQNNSASTPSSSSLTRHTSSASLTASYQLKTIDLQFLSSFHHSEIMPDNYHNRKMGFRQFLPLLIRLAIPNKTVSVTDCNVPTSHHGQTSMSFISIFL